MASARQRIIAPAISDVRYPEKVPDESVKAFITELCATWKALRQG